MDLINQYIMVVLVLKKKYIYSIILLKTSLFPVPATNKLPLTQGKSRALTEN